MLRVAVDIGGRARVVCKVARTAAEQSQGLQGHAELPEGTGMFFPFHPPRACTFHMGSVAFPIDILFADASGVVQRIVHAAQPGERTRWSHPIVGAVVEVPGGFCTRVGLEVGSIVRIAGQKLGAQTYNILRTLTEASTEEGSFDIHGDEPPLRDGYYGKEPQHQAPDFGGARTHLPAGERFQDHKLPADGGDPNAMDRSGPTPMDPMGGGSSGFEQGMGYIHPLDGESDYPLRMGGSWRGRRRAQELEVDLPTMIPKVLAGALRAGIPWEPVVLNPHRDQAVITPEVMGRWLHALGLGEAERNLTHDAATSEPGLDALSTAMISEHIAETANISHLGDQNILVLTRRK